MLPDHRVVVCLSNRLSQASSYGSFVINQGDEE
mgnify:CR=1 FL=1|jgi:hypothetical protein